MSYLRSKVVAQAQSWVGLKESDGSYKEIIDIYNGYTPLPQGYKVSYSDPWCAVFVSSTAIQCGYTAIIPPECSCPRMISLLQNLGEWVEDDAYVPAEGDIVFYDWDDTGSGDNTGTADHVGIVEKISGSTITVIEGNKSDAVDRRTIQVNGAYIRGYGVPKYDDSSSSSSSTSATLTAGTKVKLSKVHLYASATASTAANIISGNYYLWDAAEQSGRIRITNKKANVGVSGQVTGWVNVSDLGLESSTSSSGTSSSSSTTTSKKAADPAQSFDQSLAGTYTVTPSAGVNLRDGAGTGKSILAALPKGTKVENYGYYTKVSGVKWLYVQVTYNKVEYTGFCSSQYLAKA